MNHCNIRKSCEICVGDDGCYWITLSNGTKHCYHDPVRAGVNYTGLVAKIGDCLKIPIPDANIDTATTVGLVFGAVGLTASVFGVGWLVNRWRNRNRNGRVGQYYVHTNRPQMYGSGGFRQDRDLPLESPGQVQSPFWGNEFNSRHQENQGGLEMTSFASTHCLPKQDARSLVQTVPSAQQQPATPIEVAPTLPCKNPPRPPMRNKKSAVQLLREESEMGRANENPKESNAAPEPASGPAPNITVLCNCANNANINSASAANSQLDWHRSAVQLNAHDRAPSTMPDY